MVAILALWLFYIFLFAGIGNLITIHKFSVLEFSNKIFIGTGFVIAVLFFWHFFSGSNSLLLVTLFALSVMGHVKTKFCWIKSIFHKVIELRGVDRIILSLVLLIFAGYSALPSNVIDDGTYYSQSIRWFEEIGLVKGLANFDYNLIQASSLHALESVANFHFFGFRFNDLAGFFVVVILVECYLQKAKIPKLVQVLVFGLSIFCISLISAPNAETVLFALIISLFLNFSYEKEDTLAVLFIILSMVFIKLSALPLVILLFLSPGYKRKVFGAIIVFSVFFKTWYLSGYAFAPFINWAPIDVAFKIPEDAFLSWNAVKELLTYKWLLTDEFYRPHSFSEKLVQIFLKDGAGSLINLLFAGASFIYLVILIKKRRITKFGVVLGIFAVLYYATSPQGRIAFPYLALVLLLIFEGTHISTKLYRSSIVSVFGILLVLLIFPWHWMQYFFKVGAWQTHETLAVSEMLLPASTWNQIPTTELNLNGINYTMPIDSTVYCFDSPFPCNCGIVRDFLNEDFMFVPVLLGDGIKDGFGYKKVPIDSINIKMFSHTPTSVYRRYFKMKPITKVKM